MTGTSSTPWESRARLKLSQLRAAAGEGLGYARALTEESILLTQRRAELRAAAESLHWAERRNPGQSARLQAVEQELGDLEKMAEDLNRRRVAFDQKPNPAGRLYHAAESILNCLGVPHA